MSISKQCSACGEVKELSNFYKQKTGKLGFRASCKNCEHKYLMIYASNNPGKASESNRKYRENNKEKIREKQKKYRKVMGIGYLFQRLGIKNPPKELIELKRVQLQITRELRNQKNANHN